jgi:hypothetical protein
VRTDRMSVGTAHLDRLAADRGDIVVGWLLRLAVSLGIGGVLLFDAISVGLAHAAVADAAKTAAQAGADSWHTRPDVAAAYAAAVAAVKPDDKVSAESFAVDPDGTVHVRVARTATTLVLFRVSRLARYAIATSTGTARTLG